MTKSLQYLICCLLLLSFSSAMANECENPKPLRMGQVPQISREILLSQYQSLYQHLETVLKRKVEVVHMPSYTAVVEGLIDGSIDLAELGPASYAQAKKRGANVIAFASFSGQRGKLFDLSHGYRAILITRADRKLDHLDKLKGASLSLVDPASTSGALYPRHIIPKMTGLPLERYFGRISFAGSHDRAINAVRRGLTDAAFISNTKLDAEIADGKIAPTEITVVWQSELIPLDPFVYRQSLCPEVTAAIKKAFLGDPTPFRPMLDMMKRPDGFIAVSDENYRKIRQLYDSLP
ncbi:MAG: phosphate/phosphite/phosphonate ABC transporter substrate-binding protein [Dechloromonas sp.]|nr:phosphate/phosphite/phosphonate ABC transporter substrate-binding protein [Dechloromonas sp.]